MTRDTVQHHADCSECGCSAKVTHLHDYQPFPVVAGPQRIYCRTCGNVINIEEMAPVRPREVSR